MKIWVDADACPGVVREILYRVALRTQIEIILIANQRIPTPKSHHIKMLQVESGFDKADQEIVRRLQPGDIVITSDIPLADEVIKAGGQALSPRGEHFTKDNISARLSMRDLLESLRASGEQTGGPAAYNQADRKAFADQLDRMIVKAAKLPNGAG